MTGSGIVANCEYVLPIDPDSVRENTEIFGLIYAYVAEKPPSG